MCGHVCVCNFTMWLFGIVISLVDIEKGIPLLSANVPVSVTVQVLIIVYDVKYRSD